jgi:hypothetical protein
VTSESEESIEPAIVTSELVRRIPLVESTAEVGEAPAEVVGAMAIGNVSELPGPIMANGVIEGVFRSSRSGGRYVTTGVDGRFDLGGRKSLRLLTPI